MFYFQLRSFRVQALSATSFFLTFADWLAQPFPHKSSPFLAAVFPGGSTTSTTRIFARSFVPFLFVLHPLYRSRTLLCSLPLLFFPPAFLRWGFKLTFGLSVPARSPQNCLPFLPLFFYLRPIHRASPFFFHGVLVRAPRTGPLA